MAQGEVRWSGLLRARRRQRGFGVGFNRP